MFSGITMTVFMPKYAPKKASDIPVLPLVGSTNPLAPLITPLSKASFSIPHAVLSFIEPVGLKNSNFANTPFSFSSTNGVFPIVSMIFIAYSPYHLF